MKILFWGTSDFGISSLEALVENKYDVVGAVTSPDKTAGRNQALTPSPIKVLAEKCGIKVFQPEKLEARNFKLETPEADIYIVASYGKIIPKEIIELPRFGSINIHPSLLPRWRGPSPIQQAILEGDKETGVTLMLMDEKMDHGPIMDQKIVGIDRQKVQYQNLHDELAKIGAELLIEALPEWLSGEIKPVSQDEARATYSKLLKKEDGRIKWEDDALKIERMVRAYEQWPGAYTFWQRNKKLLRLEITSAEVSDNGHATGVPGRVWRGPSDNIMVETGKGNIRIFAIKPESKKNLNAKEFLNGYKDITGAILT